MVIHTLNIQKPVDSGANQEDAGFSFIPLGTAIEAVVMRLSSELPRIKVRSVLNEGGISEDGSQ